MILQSLAAVLQPLTIILVAVGTVIGIIFGSIPGLTATMAIVMFLPATYSMSATQGISMLMALYIGGISGGLISAILLNIPGTPSSVATCFDGSPMANKGEAGKALGTGVVFSFFGTLIGIAILVCLTPMLCQFALKFQSYEYCALAIFSLSMVIALTGHDMAKGLISAVLGALLATVGLAPIDSRPRFTFGLFQLNNGFSLVVLLIGLFAIAEVMVFGEDGTCKEQAVNLIYLQSTRRDCPLVVIDCFLLNEKAWEYLMEHYSSPLTGTGCTIFIKNVDVLTGERRRQLISNMLDMDICKRNRLLFSCVCRKGETATEAGMEFVEKLSCMPLFLPPMRGRSAHIPAIASMYLSYLNTMMAKDIMGLDENASRRMQDFDWPHNYTQFQRIMRELVLKTDGPYITGESVEEILRRERTVATVNTQVEDAGKPLDLSLTLSEINREIIGRVLLEEDGNQSRTALRLGISRTTLWRLLNNP